MDEKHFMRISIRRKLMLILMSRLSSLVHKLLMLTFMLMLASQVRTRLYCARKFTCHVMHRARALSTKMNMAIAIALPGFNDLGRSVTPTFLFGNIFYLQLSPHCPKMSKKINVGS